MRMLQSDKRFTPCNGGEPIAMGIRPVEIESAPCNGDELENVSDYFEAFASAPCNGDDPP